MSAGARSTGRWVIKMADMYRNRSIGDFPQFPTVENPSLWQRFTASFKAQPTMTKSVVLGAKLSPEEYNFRKNYFKHVNEDNPAETVWQHGAQLLGKGLAQATDPIGLLLAKGSGTHAQEAVAGGLAQIGESVADDIASGQKIDRTKALGNAAAGAIGAPLGSAAAGAHLGGVIPETLGRVTGNVLIEPFVTDKTGDAIAATLASDTKKKKGVFTLKDPDPWR